MTTKARPAPITSSILQSSYRLPLTIARVEDGSYLGTSPALDRLLVQADTPQEVIALAPGIAKALIEAMLEKGIKPSLAVEKLRFPFDTQVLVI